MFKYALQSMGVQTQQQEATAKMPAVPDISHSIVAAAPAEAAKPGGIVMYSPVSSESEH